MNGKIQYKTAIYQVEDVDMKNRIVTGYWSGWGNKDFDRDVILEGSARKTISERGPNGTNEIFFLQSHNWEKPLGRPTFLEDRPKGIYHETPVKNKAQFATDALESMAAGLLIQNSIGFVSMKEYDVKPNGVYDDSAYREISEIKLYEGSAVVLGANPETPFTGFKSLDLSQINDQISRIMKLLKDGTLSDEGFGRIEIALKQLQRYSFELGKESLLEKEPTLDVTQKRKEPIIVDVDSVFANYLN